MHMAPVRRCRTQPNQANGFLEIFFRGRFFFFAGLGAGVLVGAGRVTTGVATGSTGVFVLGSAAGGATVVAGGLTTLDGFDSRDGTGLSASR